MWDDRGSNPDKLLDSTFAEAITAPSSICRNYFEMLLRNVEDSTPSIQKSTQLFPVKRPSHSTTSYLKIPFNSIALVSYLQILSWTSSTHFCPSNACYMTPDAAERYTNVYSHTSKKAHKLPSRDIQLFATVVQ